MKKWRKYPLLTAVIIIGLCCSLAGLLGSTKGYTRYKNWPQTPFLASVFQGLSEHVYPWSKSDRKKDDMLMSLNPETEESTEKRKKPAGKPHHKTEEVLETETAALEVETEQTYEFTDVEQSYFDDALFIGDSRTVGLHDYSGWDNATYYASIGMTVYDLFDSPIVEENGTMITIEQALSIHQFAKIYLMVGINEMGTGTVDSFMEVYENAVRHLQELQPDAIIYVEGIMKVKREKSETDPIFNNSNIQERNDRIAKLADNKKIFYIDVNEVVTDANGDLNEEYTYDEIHLLGRHYSIWTDFLKKHGIVIDKK